MLHESEGRHEADEAQHDEEGVADHRHVPEVERRLVMERDNPERDVRAQPDGPEAARRKTAGRGRESTERWRATWRRGLSIDSCRRTVILRAMSWNDVSNT